MRIWESRSKVHVEALTEACKAPFLLRTCGCAGAAFDGSMYYDRMTAAEKAPTVIASPSLIVDTLTVVPCACRANTLITSKRIISEKALRESWQWEARRLQAIPEAGSSSRTCTRPEL